MLAMHQMVRKTAVLKRDSGVDESGRSAVVVHEKRLQTDQGKELRRSQSEVNYGRECYGAKASCLFLSPFFYLLKIRWKTRHGASVCSVVE